MKIRLHFNKPRETQGREPWTLHTSKGCYPAWSVSILVPVATENHPERKDNPRYFLACQGEIHWTSPGHATIVAARRTPSCI